jgi:hypothetical protein
MYISLCGPTIEEPLLSGGFQDVEGGQTLFGQLIDPSQICVESAAAECVVTGSYDGYECCYQRKAPNAIRNVAAGLEFGTRMDGEE